MSEFTNDPEVSPIVDCGKLAIKVVSPESVRQSVVESGFNMTLLEIYCEPSELQGVSSAKLELVSQADTEPKLVTGEVTYTLDNVAKQIGCLRDLCDKLQSFQYEDKVTYQQNQGYAEVELISGVSALIFTTQLDNSTATASIIVPVENGQSLSDDYIDILNAVELWGSTLDVVSAEKPEGKRPGIDVDPLILTIEDHHSLQPDPQDYELWQQLLPYDDWQKHMAMSSLPPLDYKDIDIPQLSKSFGVLPDSVITLAIMNIMQRKRSLQKESDASSSITHLDIFDELSRLV